MIGYYTITNQCDWGVFITSWIYGLGATLVIFGEHIDKLYEDEKKRVHTLPVILGDPISRVATVGRSF